MSTAAYAVYTEHLAMLVKDVSRGAWAPVTQDVDNALNGQAAERLRTLVPRQIRREYGVFFSTGPVRDRFASMLAPALAMPHGYYDPTCGAGDLLLAAAENLPLLETPTRTLAAWSSWLAGTDLHEPFTSAARSRLTLAAFARHRHRGDRIRVSQAALERSFPDISAGDGLAGLQNGLAAGRHVLLNPPFGAVQVDRSCSWSSGKTSMAALFAAEAVGAARRLTAILPDVLRSGSRYRLWRELMAQHLGPTSIEPYGLFDQHTDIDVFLLDGHARAGNVVDEPSWWPGRPADAATLADFFEIRVGPVVDNRDPETGPLAPFLTARNIPAKGVAIIRDQRRRRYTGRLFDPPFVVMRRTSRPGQGTGGASRGMGVLVTGDEPVAVDNHLIVAVPMEQGEARCIELLERLSDADLAPWLDERIRCRHLTVAVVKEIPWTGAGVAH